MGISLQEWQPKDFTETEVSLQKQQQNRLYSDRSIYQSNRLYKFTETGIPLKET